MFRAGASCVSARGTPLLSYWACFMPLLLGVTLHAERLSACMELIKEAKRACWTSSSWHFSMLPWVKLTRCEPVNVVFLVVKSKNYTKIVANALRFKHKAKKGHTRQLWAHFLKTGYKQLSAGPLQVQSPKTVHWIGRRKFASPGECVGTTQIPVTYYYGMR